MQLQPKHVQPVVMAGMMAFIMTAFITWLNLGWRPDFLSLWARAFVVAWPVASLAAFVASPLAPKVTQAIIRRLNASRT